jgi:hypothetical protein
VDPLLGHDAADETKLAAGRLASASDRGGNCSRDGKFDTSTVRSLGKFRAIDGLAATKAEQKKRAAVSRATTAHAVG